MVFSRFTIMQLIFIIVVTLLHKKMLIKGAHRDNKLSTNEILANRKYQRQIQSDNTRIAMGKTFGDVKVEDVEQLKSELKRELLYSVMKMIQDDIAAHEKSSGHMQKDHNSEKKDNTKENIEIQIKVSDKEESSEKAEKNKDSGNTQDYKLKETVESFRDMWKRKEERKALDKSNAEDEKANTRELRGPPGLWGRDAQKENKELSGSPPGLWGKDAADDERKRLFEALSRFKNDNKEVDSFNDKSK